MGEVRLKRRETSATLTNSCPSEDPSENLRPAAHLKLASDLSRRGDDSGNAHSMMALSSPSGSASRSSYLTT